MAYADPEKWIFFEKCLFFHTHFFSLERNTFKGDENISNKLKKIKKSCRLLSVLKLLDPDPYTIYGSGSRGSNDIRIQLDPDPQHWFEQLREK